MRMKKPATRELWPLFALCLPLLAQAQTPPSGSRGPGMPPPVMAMHPGPGMLPPYLHGLDLDEAQQDKIFQIMHAAQPRMREVEKERFKAEEALFALSRSGAWNEDQAKKLSQVIGRAGGELAYLRAHADGEIAALLTPDQRRQIQPPPRPLPERR